MHSKWWTQFGYERTALQIATHVGLTETTRALLAAFPRPVARAIVRGTMA